MKTHHHTVLLAVLVTIVSLDLSAQTGKIRLPDWSRQPGGENIEPAKPVLINMEEVRKEAEKKKLEENCRRGLAPAFLCAEIGESKTPQRSETVPVIPTQCFDRGFEKYGGGFTEDLDDFVISIAGSPRPEIFLLIGPEDAISASGSAVAGENPGGPVVDPAGGAGYGEKEMIGRQWYNLMSLERIRAQATAFRLGKGVCEEPDEKPDQNSDAPRNVTITVTEFKDGRKTVVEKYPDGSSVTVTTEPNGNITRTEEDATGKSRYVETVEMKDDGNRKTLPIPPQVNGSSC